MHSHFIGVPLVDVQRTAPHACRKGSRAGRPLKEPACWASSLHQVPLLHDPQRKPPDRHLNVEGDKPEDNGG